MIKINLLPFRAARKKENIRRQISIYILSVVFLCAAMGYVYVGLNQNLGPLKTERDDKRRELGAYAGTAKKIGEIKEKTEQIRSKLEVIRGLERNKAGPVHVLAEISMAVPKDKLWLRSLDEKRGILTLEGSAMDNDTVALFMTNLGKAAPIISVDLESTRLKNLPKYKLDITDFVLKCKTYSYKKEEHEPQTEKAVRIPRKRKR